MVKPSGVLPLISGYLLRYFVNLLLRENKRPGEKDATKDK